MKTYLTAQQNAAILKDYLLYKVQVQHVDSLYSGELDSLRGADDKWIASTAGFSGYATEANNLLPVLYDLADLAKLPRRAREGATPLVLFLRKLNFTFSLDAGLGEGIVSAEVIPNQWGTVADRTTLLHLRVHTDYVDNDTREETAGAEYEVFVSAYGQVQWKNVTASKLSEAAGTGRTAWQEADGSHLLLYAWDYLRELHVALGYVAENERHYVEAKGEYETRYRYVRKPLPAQEGGEPK